MLADFNNSFSVVTRDHFYIKPKLNLPPRLNFVVTAVSDLLVHKILLNSVLLSPIVSGGVRPKFSGQTPLGHNPLFSAVRRSVGVRTPPRGSDRARSTG